MVDRERERKNGRQWKENNEEERKKEKWERTIDREREIMGKSV